MNAKEKENQPKRPDIEDIKEAYTYSQNCETATFITPQVCLDLCNYIEFLESKIEAMDENSQEKFCREHNIHIS